MASLVKRQVRRFTGFSMEKITDFIHRHLVPFPKAKRRKIAPGDVDLLRRCLRSTAVTVAHDNRRRPFKQIREAANDGVLRVQSGALDGLCNSQGRLKKVANRKNENRKSPNRKIFQSYDGFYKKCDKAKKTRAKHSSPFNFYFTMAA